MAADSEPPEKGEDTAGRGSPQFPRQRYGVRRAKAERGGEGSGRPDFRQDSASSGVPGAWSAFATSVTNGSLLRARSTAQWNSLWGESGAERISCTVEKTSSTIASAALTRFWGGSGPPLEGPMEGEPCSDAGVAGVAAGAGALSKLGESAVDCRGVETEAWPLSSVSGSGQGTLEADPSLPSSRSCTVDSCVCECV